MVNEKLFDTVIKIRNDGMFCWNDFFICYDMYHPFDDRNVFIRVDDLWKYVKE